MRYNAYYLKLHDKNVKQHQGKENEVDVACDENEVDVACDENEVDVACDENGLGVNNKSSGKMDTT